MKIINPRISNCKTYIEQYFIVKPVFGKKSCCVINRNGYGFDKLIFKIILPNLPNNMKYGNCLYNLWNYIELDIGGFTVFKYNSFQLKELNFMKCRFKKQSNTTTIYYSIDLGKNFGRSTGIFSDFDLHFKGIRLCDLDHNEVKFNIALNNIQSIMDNELDHQSQQYKALEELEIIDASILINYVLCKSSLPSYNRSSEIKQKFKICTVDNHSIIKKSLVNIIYIKLNPFPWNHCLNWYKIKKILLIADKKNAIKNFQIKDSNENDLFGIIDANEMKIIYELDNNCTLNDNTYAIDVDLDQSREKCDLLLELDFISPISSIKIDCFFELESEFIYDHGSAVW